jgi:transposase
MPEHRLVSDDEFQRIEVITGIARRRRWSAEQKLRIVEDSLRSSESVSMVARRHGVAPNLLFRWRRLASEGGAAAVTADDGVTSNIEVRRLEERIRELERHLGRKTLEVEILKGEAAERTHSARSRAKKPILLAASRAAGDSR